MSLAFGSRQPCDNAVARRAAAKQLCTARERPWVLAVAILGSSLAFIEGSVVNLALPDLQADLRLDSSAVQWVVNVYLLVLSAFLLIGGASGDRFGLRRIFVAGLSLFGGASAFCAFATTLPSLLVWRSLQGLGAALLVPTSLALISYHFDETERGRAIGIWAGASALTTALGPVAGGWLVDAFGWPAVFVVIPPLAAATIMLTWLRVPVTPSQGGRRLDLVGAGLLAVSLGFATYGLLDPEVSVATALWLAASAVCATLLMRYEKRVEAPMLPLQLFRSSSFSGANAMTLALYFALGGALFFVPFNLIQIQGYSALQAGAAFLPLTLMLGVGSALAGDLIRRISPRTVLTGGSIVAALGFAAFIRPGVESAYAADWLPGILLVGTGMTLCVAPLTTVIMGSVDDKQAGVASGVNNTAARLASVLAIAVLTGIAVQSFRADLREQLSDANVPAYVAGDLLASAGRLAELRASADTTEALAAELRPLIEQSYVATFRRLMLLCALAAGLSALIAWLSLNPSNPKIDSSE